MKQKGFWSKSMCVCVFLAFFRRRTYWGNGASFTIYGAHVHHWDSLTKTFGLLVKFRKVYNLFTHTIIHIYFSSYFY